MVVCDTAAVDARRGDAIDVVRMHAVVDPLVAPVVLAGSDARLEIDDAQIHAGTIKFRQRIAQKKAVTHVLGSRDLVTAITGRAGIWGSNRRLEELLSAATERGETAEPEHKFRERSKHVLLMKPGGEAFPWTHCWNGSNGS